MIDSALLLQTLNRIELKVDDAATQAALAAQRAELLSITVKDHIAEDRVAHAGFNARIANNEGFISNLRGRVATWAAVAGFVISIVVGIAKDVLFGHR